ETALEQAAGLLDRLGATASQPEKNRLDFVLPDGRALHEAVRILHEARWGYLAAITGLDKPVPAPKAKPGAPPPDTPPSAEAGNLEVLYHFCEGAAVATLRVEVPYGAPSVPSVCDIVPSAALYERELEEMFGVTVQGTLMTDPLLLPEGWPQGVHPLRKAFNPAAPRP
ncbi:MAG: NADH-quinone oxidoreductase subunit C, partial [Acidobacteria bacterium]